MCYIPERQVSCKACRDARDLAAKPSEEQKRARAAEYARNWRAGRLSEKQAQDKEKHNAQARAWYEENKDVVRDRVYLKTYGISLRDAETLLASQDFKCPICTKGLEKPGREKDGGVVDHCHATGRVRGMLCSNCNTTLGFMEDDPARLRAAADYLEKDVDHRDLVS